MAHTPTSRPSGFVEFAPDRVRRFWTEVSVEPDGQGWAVRLDGRMPKTPQGHSLVLPTQAAARIVAAEWAGQGEFLDPAAMPATRLAFTAIDRVREARAATADEIAAYAGSDAVCYLAEAPAALVERQARDWTPWRDWAERELGAVLIPVAGIIHRPQSDKALAAIREHALKLDDYALTGLAMATPLFGSAVLAFAVQRGALSGAEAFDLSRLDEAWCAGRRGRRQQALAQLVLGALATAGLDDPVDRRSGTDGRPREIDARGDVAIAAFVVRLELLFGLREHHRASEPLRQREHPVRDRQPVGRRAVEVAQLLVAVGHRFDEGERTARQSRGADRDRHPELEAPPLQVPHGPLDSRVGRSTQRRRASWRRH